MKTTLLVLFLLLAAACTPAPKPTPIPRATSTRWPPAVMTPGTHPAPPEGGTATPLPYPVGTADAQPYEQDLPAFLGERIIFPIVWYLPLPVPLGKRGLAWHSTNCPDAIALGVFWYMNWDTRRNSCPPSMQPAGYYPMFRPDRIWEWYARVNTDYSGIALFLNEPNWIAQDNYPYVDAAHLYRTFETDICPGCQTIALNLAWADDGYLNGWREAYRAAYGEYPDPYAYGLHAYGSGDTIIAQVQTYRETLIAIGEADKKIWLTEFGGCWQGEQPLAHQLTPAEMGRVLAYLEAQTFVEGYAFFGVRWYKPGDPPPPGLHCQSLFDDIGMTDLGHVYAGHNEESGYPGPP